MDASGLKRTLLVEVGLRLYFGPPMDCLIGSTLGYPPLFDIRNFSYIPGIKRGEGFCLPLSLKSNEVMRKCAEGHLLKISKFST